MVSGPSRDNPDVILHDLYEPCAPRAPGAMEMNWTQVDGEKLKEPLVSLVSWNTLRAKDFSDLHFLGCFAVFVQEKS